VLEDWIAEQLGLLMEGQRLSILELVLLLVDSGLKLKRNRRIPKKGVQGQADLLSYSQITAPYGKDLLSDERVVGDLLCNQSLFRNFDLLYARQWVLVGRRD